MAVPSKRKKQGDAGSKNTTKKAKKDAKSGTKKLEQEMDEVEDENEDEPLTSMGPKKGPKSEPEPFSKPATKQESTPTTPLSLGKRLNPTEKLHHLISISVQPVSSSVQDPQANIIFQKTPSSPTQISITDSQIALTKLKDESTTSSDSGEESCEEIELPTTERVPR